MTNEIEYGGNDMLEVYNRHQMKQRLSSSNQYLASNKVSLDMYLLYSLEYRTGV